jgi:hypothetical protein
MCDFEKGFILCTCVDKEKPVIHNKNSRRYKKNPNNEPQIYRWYLSEFIDTFDSMMEGIYQFPSDDIGKGLTAEWVLLHLNDGNCFDFDYTPKEGDNLVINQSTKTYTHIHLSFIFQNGIWVQKHYHPYSTMLKQKQAGVVQELKENNI